jgi:chemotaxis signal transduction protein
MKNVIVFALGPARYAVELRWVREVITLGHVTPVPHAPEGIEGVVNYRGAITSVLDIDLLIGDRATAATAAAGRRAATLLTPAHAGESAILIEVDDLTAALRTTSVVEVATLRVREGHPDQLMASSGLPVPLIDPSAVLARAQQSAIAAAAALPAMLARGGRGTPT